MVRGDDDTLPRLGRAAVGPTDETVEIPVVAHATAQQGRENASTTEPVTRAGDYLVGGALAEGGFGVVYRGEHATHGTPAAIKVLHAELATHPDVIRRFEREVEVIQRVRHPNVIDLFDFGQLDDGRPYFAMELLDGRNLEQHLQARGRLPPDEVLAILEPLCSALEAAHAQGIVHRDIKPSNVFLCEQDGGVRVVLLDFGVAKLLDAPGPALTTSRHVVGSLSCMAPEQLTGRPVDARTDVYALGALMHALLTGEPPFAGSLYPVVRQLHLFASPPRPSARARVSAAMDDVVLRALSKSPTERQRTVGELLADFRAAVALPHAATASQTSDQVRPALGIHVDVQADPGALDNPDDLLLDDFEAILPFALSELAGAGFAQTLETGTSALLTTVRPADATSDEQMRRAAVHAALSLQRRIVGRAGRDPRVHVRFCIHVGELVEDPTGAVTGGELLELSAWVPEGLAEGVFASTSVLDGLGLAAQPAPAVRGSGALLRVLDPERR